MSPKGMLDTSIKIQNNVLQIDTDARKKNGQYCSHYLDCQK